MNSEQLQDWLAELGDTFKTAKKKTEAGYRKALNEHAQNLQVLISYLHCNYEDHRLVQPVLAQLLALYYRLGIARCFTLQVVPSLIGLYLFGLAKRQKNNVSTLETFFLAIYNEEVLAGGVGSPTMQKKVEEVRIPSIRCPSIYHDPNKLLPYPEVTQLKLNAPPSVQNTVRIGPYPAVERMIAENRFMVLTRLLRSVNSLLSQMTTDVVCRSICQTLMNVCRSGFATSESSFRRKILGEEASEEVFPDRGKKPRVPVAPHFLIEALNAVNFALFNGQADMGLRALDAVHQRAQHDLLADVLLETNAIRESLLDTRSQQMMRDSISYTRPSA